MSRKLAVTAFVVGAVAHAIFLAAAFWGGPLKQVGASCLLLFALPGAIVDMTAEVLHPKEIGIALLVLVACCANGLAYAAIAKMTAWLLARGREAS